MNPSFVYNEFRDRRKNLRQAEINLLRIETHLYLLRTKKGVSMRELANACGFRSAAHICDLEKGKRNWTEEAAMKAEEFLRLYDSRRG